jgi:hypothetical protein
MLLLLLAPVATNSLSEITLLPSNLPLSLMLSLAFSLQFRSKSFPTHQRKEELYTRRQQWTGIYCWQVTWWCYLSIKRKLTSGCHEIEGIRNHCLRVYEELHFKDELHTTPDTWVKKLTVIKHATVDALHCQWGHIIRATGSYSETHVVSRQVLIVYLINRFIMVFVLSALSIRSSMHICGMRTF